MHIRVHQAPRQGVRLDRVLRAHGVHHELARLVGVPLVLDHQRGDVLALEGLQIAPVEEPRLRPGHARHERRLPVEVVVEARVLPREDLVVRLADELDQVVARGLVAREALRCCCSCPSVYDSLSALVRLHAIDAPRRPSYAIDASEGPSDAAAAPGSGRRSRRRTGRGRAPPP